MSSEPTQQIKDMVKARGMSLSDLPPLVYMVEEGSEEYTEDMKTKTLMEGSQPLKEYIMDNFSPAEQKQLKEPKSQSKISKPLRGRHFRFGSYDANFLKPVYFLLIQF